LRKMSQMTMTKFLERKREKNPSVSFEIDYRVFHNNCLTGSQCKISSINYRSLYNFGTRCNIRRTDHMLAVTIFSLKLTNFASDKIHSVVPVVLCTRTPHWHITNTVVASPCIHLAQGWKNVSFQKKWHLFRISLLKT